jgi:hypothetical protein
MSLFHEVSRAWMASVHLVKQVSVSFQYGRRRERCKRQIRTEADRALCAGLHRIQVHFNVSVVRVFSTRVT